MIGAHKRTCVDHQNMPNHHTSIYSYHVYIETTYEPQLNLSVPLDESSLELCPSQNPSSTSGEEVSIKTIVNNLDNCIKTVVGVQNKLSDYTLTKLDLLNALEFTLSDLQKVKSKLSII